MLLQLKISANEITLKQHLEQTVKSRLQTDITDSFGLHAFSFNSTDDIQLNTVREFMEYVKKLAESMGIINDYEKLFSSSNISYIRICFFEVNGASDCVRSSIYLFIDLLHF